MVLTSRNYLLVHIFEVLQGKEIGDWRVKGVGVGDFFFLSDGEIIHTYFNMCWSLRRKSGLFEKKFGLLGKIPLFSQKNLTQQS